MVQAHLARGARRALRDVGALSAGPLPWPRMARTGISLALAFGPLAAMGLTDAAVISTLFANLLLFLDQAGPLRERLAVVAAGALACGAAGALGALLSGHPVLVPLVTLLFALGAGLVHSWVPGIEMIPRQGLICFVACAYLPLVSGATAAAAAWGATCACAGALADGLIRRGFDSPRFVEARLAASFPGLRFGAIYGLTVLAGMLAGQAAGFARSYWVAITVLVVMQRDPRASALRAVQRLLGTVIGVVLAYAVVLFWRPSDLRPEFIGLILVLPFLWPLGLARNYGLGIVLLSIWVLLLIDLVLPSNQDAAEIFIARLTDTAIGCVLAIGGTILVSRPRMSAAA